MLEIDLSHTPQPGERPVSVRLRRGAEASVRRGEPWVFDTAVTRVSHDGAAGDTAVLYDHRNKLVGVGLFDPDSPIRVRVLASGGAAVGPALFAERIDAALERREALSQAPNTTGWRVLHGPNDGLPGLVADLYASTLVLKFYSAAWTPRLRTTLPHLLGALARRGVVVDRVVTRTARAVADAFARLGLGDGAVFGAALDGPVLFHENGIVYEAEPIVGQKTGFFLDQRENRERIEALAAGRATLNVFSYTGGFSLYAARGGAARVRSVDISAPASAACERNFAHNRKDPRIAATDHRAVTGDAFEVLDAMRRDGERFGLVIIDPPSFAKRAAETERALHAYARLARLGLDVLEPGGVIALASCSSRVTPDAFRENAERTARAHGRPLDVFDVTGQPVDHPATFADAAYLKCIYARA